MIKGEVNTLHVRCIASELTGVCHTAVFLLQVAITFVEILDTDVISATSKH